MQEFSSVLHPADWRYNMIFTILVIFFAFFYTSVVFNPVDVADNLKKSGGFVPGIRPGKNTAQYIERVLSRITFAGALYLSVVCMIPALLQKYFQVPFQFGGTGLLIVVGVALDTVQQIESHLITRNYEGFAGPKGPRIRGRVGAPGLAGASGPRADMRIAPQVAKTSFASMRDAVWSRPRSSTRCARRPSRESRPGISIRSRARGIDKHKVKSARSSATIARTRRCCARRSTRSSSTASRARTRSSRTATSSGSTSASSSTASAPTPPGRSLIGSVSDEKKQLVETAREALENGHRAVPRRATGSGTSATRSRAMRNHTAIRSSRQFVGHGTGRQMHEDPQVPNFRDGTPGSGKRMKTGLVIAVEPMVNAGTPEVEVLDDNWTAVTKDRSMSAHFEHTIAVTDDGPWVLTRALVSLRREES